MSTKTTAGTTLGICASTPATFDQPGYEASVMIYSTVGEVTDLGNFGRKYNLVKHNPIASRGTVKKKGSFDEGSIALKLGLDNNDAGQVIVQAAVLSDNDYSFCIALSTGKKYYFQAQVMDFMINAGTVDNIIAAAVDLELTTDSATGTGIVKV